MTTPLCPVCGEPSGAAAESCDACGALLMPEMLERAGESAAPVAEIAEPEAAEGGAETEELLAAFRAQFERREVYLPPAWVRRLAQLAVAAETSRRQALIFFVDLRHYTALTQQLSETQLDSLRQWFYDLCRRCVERHGGFIIQFLGDGVFAAFGAPWAFERDAESGLQALLDIREEMLRRGPFEGHDLALRAGADWGTVNVRLTHELGRPRPDLFGSAVNLAARLQAAAETWEIWISDNLAEMVRNLFVLEPRTPFTPKNFDRAVQPWAVAEHRGAQALRRRQDMPFVGRREELRRIREAILRLRDGEFAAIHLAGEAGIGKTRLVQEAFGGGDHAGVGLVVVDCEPHGRYTLLGALLQALRTVIARSLGGRLPESPARQIEALRRACPRLEPLLLPTLGYLLGEDGQVQAMRSLPGPTLRRQAVSAMVGALRALAAGGPLALFIDDVQWLDPLSVETLESLLADPPGGLLLLTAGRDVGGETANKTADGAARIAMPAFLTRPPSQTLRLEPLAAEDRERLLGGLIDLEQLHPLVLRRLMEETEGIPLYLVEMARHLAEKDSLPPVSAALATTSLAEAGGYRRA